MEQLFDRDKHGLGEIEENHHLRGRLDQLASSKDGFSYQLVNTSEIGALFEALSIVWRG